MPDDPRPFSSDELLEHVGFLRSLATELVGASDAPDVVQEAWTRALERPPRERSALRAWLAVVVSNLARNRRRSDARRVRREEDSARPEASEPEPLALEALELQRVIGELVVALPAEQRTVVYLRYFEGLTPSAIAARLDVPVKTIKTRHTRALAALRTRLDARSGGNREAWVALLTPWIRVPAATGSSLGVAALAAAAVALLGLSWFLWPTAERPADAPVEVASAREAAPPPTPPDVARREASDPLGAAASPPRARVAVLTGRVIRREGGGPVAGASVEVGLPGSTDRPSATTDENGAYRIEWPKPVTVRSLAVAAMPETTGAVLSLDLRVASGTAAPDLEVTRGATLEGDVLDGDGNPVPDAEVRAWCRADFDPTRTPDRTARSDAAGRFRIEHLGEAFTLTAGAPGLACVDGLRGELAAGSSAQGLSVVLGAPATIRGHVRDAGGRAVVGATLAIRPHGGSSSRDGTAVTGVRRFDPVDCSATSDERGAFELGPLPARSWNARVTHPDFLFADVPLGPARDDNEVVLDPGYVVRGIVRDASGAGVVGAEVSLDPQEGEERHTTSDANGGFELHALAPDENAVLTVLADAHAVFARQPVRIGLGGDSFLDVRLEPEAILAGRAVDETGRPLVDAHLTLEGARELHYRATFDRRTTLEWAVGIDETYTDDEGRFRFTRLYPGAFELRVHPADAPGLWLAETFSAGREDVELVVERTRLEHVVFAGTVTDARTSSPLKHFTVAAWKVAEDGAYGHSQRCADGAGAFRSAGHEPGRYYLTVEAPGYARWKSETADFVEGESRFAVALFPTRTFQLVVREELGRSARIEFETLEGRPLWIETAPGFSSSALDVGDEPQAIGGLPCAPVRLKAQVKGEETLTVELDLTDPPTAPIEIVLPPSDAIECEVTVLFTNESALAGRIDADEDGRRALEDGRLRVPERAVELRFLGEGGDLLLQGAVTPTEDGQFRLATWFGGSAGWSNSTEPTLHARVSRRARRLVARTEGCPELSLALDLEHEPAAFGLVLLRSTR